MKKLKDLRVAEMIQLLNKYEEKRIKTYLKLCSYKQKRKKEEYRRKVFTLDKLIVSLHNNILKYIPKETMLVQGETIVKSWNNTLWNNYTNIKFY